jgi:hypothetical protein
MDNNRTEQLLKFVDSGRVRIDVFGDNKSGERAYRRAERIASAVFLITNHVSDTEMLKRRVRSLSVSLLETLLKLKDELRVAESSAGKEARGILKELNSLVRLLTVAGYVSPANADVMSDSIEELHAFLLSALRTPLSESMRLSKDFLSGVHEDVGVPVVSMMSREAPLSQVAAPASVRSRAERVVSDTSGVRTAAIISVLTGGSVMGIKDIVSQLPEYSEKMVQRELADMVDKGIVRKEGLKRWSRYALVRAEGVAAS